MTLINEWFERRNPRYEEEVRRIITTACGDCMVDISGWKAEKDSSASLYIGMLSGHQAIWRDSWRGRLRIAWYALCGQTYHQIEFDSPEEADNFIEHVRAVRQEVWPL